MWDVVVIGSGVIGLSLARELNKLSLKVLILERGEPGGGASHAAAGMLADIEAHAPLRKLATLSARMYPQFVRELEDESGRNVDLRANGTIEVLAPSFENRDSDITFPFPQAPMTLEPGLALGNRSARFIEERSVDPRPLIAALTKAAEHRHIEIVCDSAATGVIVSDGRAAGVDTRRAAYAAPIVVNCAGAWAGTILPCAVPTRPVKGHMLCVEDVPALQHVIRAPEVYLVPRTDGRVLIGSTVEEVGFDERLDAATIRRLHKAALELVPGLRDARIRETWTGLRPGTPDDLPILGATALPGYFVATGHFRDGILLAPITARLMSQLIAGRRPDCDIEPYDPRRFE